MAGEHPTPPNDDSPAKALPYIPGAGNIAMFLLLVSLGMLFLATIAAFLIIRSKTQYWPPPAAPAIPNSLWFSTMVILATSVTAQLALLAIRADDERGLLRYLKITFALGIAFLLLQTANWITFYIQLRRVGQLQGAYLGGFYVLTGLHAAHVIGGLIPLALVIHHARRSVYSRNYHPGVRYSVVYWHFLDAIWLALFAVLYF